MQVFVQIKAAGKRRPVLEKKPYTLPDDIRTLRALLCAVVDVEVSRYNAKTPEVGVIDYLTQQEIEDASVTGKVGFGARYSSKNADGEKARNAALQGFADGLFRVFLNDRELTEPDAPLHIAENDMLTFIRFTFLSGRLW